MYDFAQRYLFNNLIIHGERTDKIAYRISISYILWSYGISLIGISVSSDGWGRLLRKGERENVMIVLFHNFSMTYLLFLFVYSFYSFRNATRSLANKLDEARTSNIQISHYPVNIAITRQMISNYNIIYRQNCASSLSYCYNQCFYNLYAITINTIIFLFASNFYKNWVNVDFYEHVVIYYISQGFPVISCFISIWFIVYHLYAYEYSKANPFDRLLSLNNNNANSNDNNNANSNDNNNANNNNEGNNDANNNANSNANSNEGNNDVIIHIQRYKFTKIIHCATDYLVDNSNQETHCSICLEKLEQPKVIKLECGHFYHRDCLVEWILNNLSCPMCRAVIC